MDCRPSQARKSKEERKTCQTPRRRKAMIAQVIVPWKSSELGNALGISTMLDDSRQPIDKEVFMRMLSYYEIRSETARPGSAPTEKNAAQPNTAAQRRKP